MPNSNNYGITGVDGHAPVYDPNSAWRIWALHEVYIGQAGLRKYVPKVDDLVFDVQTGFTYRCVAIDQTTLVPTLQDWSFKANAGTGSDSDRLIGAGPLGHEETIRLYVDKSVFPYEACVDQYYTIGAVQARYARVFRGSVTQNNQEVISSVYDQNNNFLGNDVPLELVALSNNQNVATKTVAPFHTNFDLKDHDLVTIIFYADNGHVVSMRTLVVMESGFIRSGAADQKYITHISLETPYNSKTEPGVIVYPVNLPLTAVNMFGVVHYSNGETRRMAVDGTRFKVLGMTDYVATIPNQEFDITLRYTLTDNEAVYGTVIGEEHFMTETYRVRTGQVDNIWSVKLYCYPVWIDAISGYRLAWYLFNLERATYYRVDSLIKFNDTNPLFNPTQYGVRQRLSVTINLADVSSIYSNYDHVQVVEVELLKQGTEEPTLWRVADYNSNITYGTGLAAEYVFVNQNLKRLRVSNGAATFNEWLNQIYRNTNPLYSKFSESEAPEPTHMMLSTDSSSQFLEVDITNWDQEIAYNHSMVANETLFIRLVRRIAGNDLQLSMAAMPLKQRTSF